MGNVFFEHNLIKVSDLPVKWQSSSNMRMLERFLQDNWKLREALYHDDDESKEQQFIGFDHRDAIKTKKYIGTIIFEGEQITIFPKVYDSSKGNPTPNNLIKDLTIWLHYCNSAKYPFIKMPSGVDTTKDTFEIFAAIYLQCVEQTLKKSSYMAYEDIRETGSAVKGKIDFVDYRVKKYPSGKRHLIDYTYSGFVFDNKVNRIIKSTCMLINRKIQSSSNKSLVRKILSQLDDVTEMMCSASDCDTVSIQGINSPYKVIMQLSKMFLLNKSSSGMLGKLDAFCFLFPADLLFEGFIAGFVREVYENKATVIAQLQRHYFAETLFNGMPYGKAFKLKEDIIIDAGEGTTTVLDTKYKIIDRLSKVVNSHKLEISDNDIRQIAVYAMVNDAVEGCLIYPLKREEDPDEDSLVYIVKEKHNNYYFAARINILRVPFTFSENEKDRMDCLKRQIEGIMK